MACLPFLQFILLKFGFMLCEGCSNKTRLMGYIQ
jgi:hypothetical protein